MKAPSHGIRFELLREGDAPPRYRVELRGPAATWTGEATVAPEDGAVTFAPFAPEEPPAWAISTLRGFLRSEWRSRRDDPETPWPSRLTRWRAERLRSHHASRPSGGRRGHAPASTRGCDP